MANKTYEIIKKTKIKKKRRMRVLSARIFKSFGGKIDEIWTAVTMG